jgi:hypothetical protein
MDMLISYLNTMVLGMMSSALYFVVRDVERLTARVDELEEDSLVLDDYEDEDDEEVEVTVRDVEKKDI